VTKRLNIKDFISRAKLKHDDQYDYYKYIYMNNYTKGIIVCPKHGEFLQRPKDHLNGNGCPICSDTLFSKKEFVEKAHKIHGEYDYSQFVYTRSKSKSIIICLIHGKFEQSPTHHLAGTKCPKCRYDKKRTSLKRFVKCASICHKNKYNYSKSIYINNHTKGIIICPKHGEFLQRPKDHLNGNGCPICKPHTSKEETLFVDFLKKYNMSRYSLITKGDNGYNKALKNICVKYKYKPDLFLKRGEKLIVVEYDGNFWHGFTKKYKVHPITKKSIIAMRKYTLKRKKDLESLNIEVINVLGGDWKKYKTTRYVNTSISRLFYLLKINIGDSD